MPGLMFGTDDEVERAQGILAACAGLSPKAVSACIEVVKCFRNHRNIMSRASANLTFDMMNDAIAALESEEATRG